VDGLALRLLVEARERINKDFRRVLLLPPDLTRAHSGAGIITETIYKALAAHCDVHVIPTLGQHIPHSAEQNRWMFGNIPNGRIHVHDWIGGVTRVGTIPAHLVEQSTGGLADWEIPVDLNTSLMRESWDLIINIGHVVPHEVLGFANHNKNYFIGLGGKDTICAAHMAAACCGIENNLGNLLTPVRQCFNWAEDKFLGKLPDQVRARAHAVARPLGWIAVALVVHDRENDNFETRQHNEALRAAHQAEALADLSVGQLSSGGGGGYGPYFGSIPDFGQEANGVKFSDVRPGSPAAKAGFKAGDILVQFGDKPIQNLYDFTDALRRSKVGDVVEVKVMRDGKPLTASVKLEQRK